MINENDYILYKLTRIPGFGNKSINVILSTLERNKIDLSQLFKLSKSDFSRLFPMLGIGRFNKANFESLSKSDENEVYNNYQKIIEQGIEFITINSNTYPNRLKDILEDEAPVIIYYKGYKSLLNSKGFSIVGSRNVSDIGIEITSKIVKFLTNKGYNIISGFAKGVDMAAHNTALENDGTTTAVLSYGINYLPQHKIIHDLSNALILSQFDPNTKWHPANAMIRNKLVCSLSIGVIIIHSGPEKDDKGRMSGTFNAGKTALNFGIPTFVINPQILSDEPVGNKELIERGANEISDPEHIIQILNSQSNSGPSAKQQTLF